MNYCSHLQNRPDTTGVLHIRYSTFPLIFDFPKSYLHYMKLTLFTTGTFVRNSEDDLMYWRYDDEQHILTTLSTQHRHLLFFHLTSIDPSSGNSIPTLLWRPHLQLSVLVLWGELIPLQAPTGIGGGIGVGPMLTHA